MKGRIQNTSNINIAVSTSKAGDIYFPVLRNMEAIELKDARKILQSKLDAFKNKEISLDELEDFSAVYYDFSDTVIHSGFVPIHYGSAISMALYPIYTEATFENNKLIEKKRCNISLTFDRSLLGIKDMGVFVELLMGRRLG